MHRLTVSYFTPAGVEDFDGSAFDASYREEHVPLVAALPGLRRFVTSHPRALGPGEAPYLVAELWFDDAPALEAALGSPEGAATAANAQELVGRHGVASMTMATGSVEDRLA